MLKKCLTVLKQYETIESNSQRLNKGYKPKRIINKIYKIIYGDG